MELGHSDMHGFGNSAGNNVIATVESTGKPPPAPIMYQLHGLIRQKKPTSHYVCLQLTYAAGQPTKSVTNLSHRTFLIRIYLLSHCLHSTIYLR